MMRALGQQVRSSLGEEPVRVSVIQTQHQTRKVEKASQENTASLDQNARLCQKMWVLGS